MAAARAAASDMARMALAPRRLLLGVPSSSIMRLSRANWSSAGLPVRAWHNSPLTAATAFSTDWPPNFVVSPSRSSQASWLPVLAPLGTAARPEAPLSSVTSASTVGLPRLSKICRACIEVIFIVPSSHKAYASASLCFAT